MDDSLDFAHTPYLIVVDRSSFTLRLIEHNREIARWTVGVGKAGAPTPAGRTFIVAAISDPEQTFSPVILPLGMHSETHTTFAGGPGTVAVHGWPSPEVFGAASSDGCIRVPDDALSVLARDVPIGTPVLIT
ncbi:L,D-transpeptidase [Actinokineospora sp. HUAS TT18]|uniref:L,D-transpeptidase n=1 Tax=Actinokineospora sp. HUAS TT18 TaxID=3447451 RepID=UPI003F51B44B